MDRYLVYPGQAVSYKVGELEFLRLRRLAEGALGDRFDVRAYHDRILQLGVVPLSLLAERVERYISEEKERSDSRG